MPDRLSLQSLRSSLQSCASDLSEASLFYDEVACESPIPRRPPPAARAASSEAPSGNDEDEAGAVWVVAAGGERVFFPRAAAAVCTTLATAVELDGEGGGALTVDAGGGRNALSPATLRAACGACLRLGGGSTSADVVAAAPLPTLLPLLRASGYLGVDALGKCLGSV